MGRKNRRTYMLGDPVEVIIQKVDVLRHQIDLAVVLPEGYEAVEGKEDGKAYDSRAYDSRAYDGQDSDSPADGDEA